MTGALSLPRVARARSLGRAAGIPPRPRGAGVALLLAAAGIMGAGAGGALAQSTSLPQALLCTLTELSCVADCPAVALRLDAGTAAVSGLSGGDLAFALRTDDPGEPPTFGLSGASGRGLVGLRADGSATLILKMPAASTAYEGPCVPLP